MEVKFGDKIPADIRIIQSSGFKVNLNFLGHPIICCVAIMIYFSFPKIDPKQLVRLVVTTFCGNILGLIQSFLMGRSSSPSCRHSSSCRHSPHCGFQPHTSCNPKMLHIYVLTTLINSDCSILGFIEATSVT